MLFYMRHRIEELNARKNFDNEDIFPKIKELKETSSTLASEERCTLGDDMLQQGFTSE